MKYRVIKRWSPGCAEVGSIIEPEPGVAQLLLARKAIEPVEDKGIEGKRDKMLRQTKRK